MDRGVLLVQDRSRVLTLDPKIVYQVGGMNEARVDAVISCPDAG